MNYNKKVNINKEKYLLVKTIILEALSKKPMTRGEILDYFDVKKINFNDPISYYVEAARLDLIAKNVIKRIEGKPIRYALK